MSLVICRVRCRAWELLAALAEHLAVFAVGRLIDASDDLRAIESSKRSSTSECREIRPTWCCGHQTDHLIGEMFATTYADGYWCPSCGGRHYVSYSCQVDP